MRLLDCFNKIFAYTSYLRQGNGEARPSVEDAIEDYERFLSQAESSARTVGFSDEDLDNAKFAVCAWVDETIMLSDWEGRIEWGARPLQRRHFDTTNAGEEFFEHLDELPPQEKEVREVYVTCLGLGFRGLYFHESEQSVLNDERNNHLEALWSESDMEHDLAGGKLFPEAYYTGPAAKGPKQPWVGFDPFTACFLLVPPTLLITLFLLYRFFLNKSIFDFFRFTL